MPKNVIILTTGLAGSSVLTGLLTQAGYWTGEDTFKKSDYDTYENQALVDLNRRIFKETGYQRNYTMEFDAADVRAIAERSRAIDPQPFREFIARCNEHRPWIWKDPRLSLTIRFWKDLLDLDDVQFIILKREEFQTWVSTTIRRQIQTRDYCRRYTRAVEDSLAAFLAENGRPHLEIVYEDILMKPEDTLARINAFLGTGLGMDDLRRIYRKPLYRKQRGIADTIKAGLIYFKNYRLRYR
jgi:hypothetical protein